MIPAVKLYGLQSVPPQRHADEFCHPWTWTDIRSDLLEDFADDIQADMRRLAGNPAASAAAWTDLALILFELGLRAGVTS